MTNRFERQIYDCMIPTARLLDQTTNEEFWVLGQA